MVGSSERIAAVDRFKWVIGSPGQLAVSGIRQAIELLEQLAASRTKWAADLPEQLAVNNLK